MTQPPDYPGQLPRMSRPIATNAPGASASSHARRQLAPRRIPLPSQADAQSASHRVSHLPAPRMPLALSARQSSSVSTATGVAFDDRPTVVARNLIKEPDLRKGKLRLVIDNFELYPGELTYIGGANGAGKSTFMKILVLESKPDSGSLSILDQDVTQLSSHERDELRGGGISYIPQKGLGILLHLSPMEQITRMLIDYEGISNHAAEARTEAAIGRTNLKLEAYTVPAQNLSGGEQARVAIALASASERPLLLADEILPAMDDESRIDVIDLLQDMAADGYTVAIVAHHPELRDRFHRVIEMANGQIIRVSHNPTPRRGMP